MERSEKDLRIVELTEKIKQLQSEIENLKKYNLNELEKEILSCGKVSLTKTPTFNYNLTQMGISEETTKDEITDATIQLQVVNHSFLTGESFMDYLKNYLDVILIPHRDGSEISMKAFTPFQAYSENRLIAEHDGQIIVRMFGITSELRINAIQNNKLRLLNQY